MEKVEKGMKGPIRLVPAVMAGSRFAPGFHSLGADGPVQLRQQLIQVKLMYVCPMFQSFEIRNLALETFQPVFFENLQRLGVKPDYLTDMHIPRYHKAPFETETGEVHRSRSPVSE